MKILFSPCHYIYDEVSGGSEFSWAFNIANRIACKNTESVVVTGFTKLESRKPYKIIELQKKTTNIDTSLKNAIRFNIQYFIETTRQLNYTNFDVVHHVLPFSIGNTFNLSAVFGFVGRPFVVGPIQNALTYQDTDVNPSNIRNAQSFSKQNSILQTIYKSSGFILNILSNITLKRAKKIVVINEYTRNFLIKKGIKPNNISIIPPGIDIRKFEYVPYDKKTGVLEILVVCYLVKRKAVDLIIEAVNYSIKEKNIILRIVGDGPQKQYLETLVERLGLQSNVFFEGFVENYMIQEYYKKAHVFVNMSRSEGFATVCLEAMASGLAIISSKVGGFQDAITDGKNGYLVEQEDTKGLAEKMVYLIDHPELIASFGKRARQEVEEKYDWDKVIIPRYLDLYDEILK